MSLKLVRRHCTVRILNSCTLFDISGFFLTNEAIQNGHTASNVTALETSLLFSDVLMGQVFLSTPESAVDPSVMRVWRMTEFSKRCCAVVIDEAHCLNEW